jgi:hypothetical protein
MNKKTLRIAEEILKAAEDLIFAAYYEFPAKGNYHNNPTNIDAHIGQTEQKKINNSCRLKARQSGVSDRVFNQVLKNLTSLFLNATPETSALIPGKKNDDAYDKRYYRTSSNIENHNYSIRFMVKFPTTDPKRKKPNAINNKLYSIEVHK